MRRGMRVIDADGHTIEAVDLYERYLERPFRDRVKTLDVPSSPMPIREVDGVPTLRLSVENPQEDAEQYESWNPQAMIDRFGEPAIKGWDAASYATAIAAEGVDLSILYGPGYDIWIPGIDPELAAAMAKAYCRWLTDYAKESGGRILGAAPLPIQDVGRAVEVLRFARDELGMVAFWCRPNPIEGRTLGDAYYDPLYAELERLDVPLGIHNFMGSELPSAGSDSFHRNIALHVCEHPMEQQMAMLSMMVNGVYERFPQLRVAYLEGGSAWLPWWLERIEEHFEVARWNEVAGLSLSPTEYFKRNCYVSTDADERLLYQVIEVLGDDRILFPTDYPHPDAKYPGVVDSFLDLPRGGEESKRKILWDNAVAFYGFDEAGLAAPDESTG